MVFGQQKSDPYQLFNKANQAYSTGKYSVAISMYEELLAKGYRSAEVYFNAGNSYFKENNISKAILNYERALTIQPNDEDVIFNLKMAYNNTVDKIEPVPLLFYQRWWQSLLHTLTPDAWSSAAIVCLWITLVTGLAYLFASSANGKRNSFLLTLSFIGISCIVYFLAYSSNKAIYGKNEAIITSSTTYIRSSPNEKSTKLFMLHEGTKVKVVDEHEGWKQIKIANGNVGWIENVSVEKI